MASGPAHLVTAMSGRRVLGAPPGRCGEAVQTVLARWWRGGGRVHRLGRRRREGRRPSGSEDSREFDISSSTNGFRTVGYLSES